MHNSYNAKPLIYTLTFRTYTAYRDPRLIVSAIRARIVPTIPTHMLSYTETLSPRERSFSIEYIPSFLTNMIIQCRQIIYGVDTSNFALNRFDYAKNRKYFGTAGRSETGFSSPRVAISLPRRNRKPSCVTTNRYVDRYQLDSWSSSTG